MNNRLLTTETLSQLASIPGENEFKRNTLITNGVHYDKGLEYIPCGNVPFYRPLVAHNRKDLLVAAVQECKTGQTLLCAEHLDIYKGKADESMEQLVLKLINERSQSDIENLSNKYPDCFKENCDFTKPTKIPIVHHIEFADDCKYKQPFIYRINVAYLEKVKAQLDDLEKQGIIEIGTSEYAAPLCVVPKANSTELRLCGDFRAINLCTRPDKYPLPRIDEIKQKVTGYVFSVLDLTKGFYQIPIHPGDKHKTAMQTPFGLYVYNRMPFGLRNAPPTFQRFMDRILVKLDNVIAYIDDVIIYSNTYEEHLEHLDKLFQRFEEYGLIINFKKSHFFQTEVTYLGFVINARGYRPSSTVIPKFDKLEPPVDKEGVQRFMGIVNYYREHMPGMAEFGTKLYDLVKKYVKFKWTAEHQQEFEILKQMCQERLLLVPFRVGVLASVYTDASCVACGAVLVQENKLVQCFSKAFDPREQRYSTFDRECYGMILAIKHFRHLLVGTPFVVYTDHKPLLKWMNKPPVNERHARWITQVQDLLGEIKYIAGPENVLADLLSRPRGLLKSVKDDLPVIASIVEWTKEVVPAAQVPIVSEEEKRTKSYQRQRRFAYENRMKWQSMRDAAGTYEYRVWLTKIYRPKFHEIRKKVRTIYGRHVSREMDWLQYGNYFGIDPEIIRHVAPEWGGHTGVDSDITWIPTVTLNNYATEGMQTRSKARKKLMSELGPSPSEKDIRPDPPIQTRPNKLLGQLNDKITTKPFIAEEVPPEHEQHIVQTNEHDQNIENKNKMKWK